MNIRGSLRLLAITALTGASCIALREPLTFDGATQPGALSRTSASREHHGEKKAGDGDHAEQKRRVVGVDRDPEAGIRRDYSDIMIGEGAGLDLTLAGMLIGMLVAVGGEALIMVAEQRSGRKLGWWAFLGGCLLYLGSAYASLN